MCKKCENNTTTIETTKTNVKTIETDIKKFESEIKELEIQFSERKNTFNTLKKEWEKVSPFAIGELKSNLMYIENNIRHKRNSLEQKKLELEGEKNKCKLLEEKNKNMSLHNCDQKKITEINESRNEIEILKREIISAENEIREMKMKYNPAKVPSENTSTHSVARPRFGQTLKAQDEISDMKYQIENAELKLRNMKWTLETMGLRLDNRLLEQEPAKKNYFSWFNKNY